MRTQLPLPKKGAQPPIFGPCLLWQDGWMGQYATWHGGRSRPRPHYPRYGLSSHPFKRGRSPPIFGHICCGQRDGWIKMPLGREVGRSRSDIVLDGDQAPPAKGAQQPPPCFRPISIVATVAHLSYTAENLFNIVSQKRFNFGLP